MKNFANLVQIERQTMEQDATLTWLKAQTLLAKGERLKRAFWADEDFIIEEDGEWFRNGKLWIPLQDDKAANDWMLV